MKNLIYIFTIFLILTIGGFAKARTVKFCAAWPNTSYEDSNKGEQYLTNSYFGMFPLIKNTVAKVTVTSAFNGHYTTKSYNVITDDYGCTPEYLAISNYSYKVTFYAAIKTGTRTVQILADKSTAWPDGTNSPIIPSYTTGPYRFDTFSSNTQYIIKWVNIPINKYSAMMRTYSYILSKTINEDLGWPEKAIVNIASRSNDKLCYHPDYDGKTVSWHNKNIKNSDGWTITNLCIHPDHVHRKFIHAHEFGHALADANAGPGYMTSYYDADGSGIAQSDISSAACTSYGADLNTPPEITHSLTSREWTGASAKEGFVNFFASLMYNKVGSTDTFVYYKPSIKASSMRSYFVANGSDIRIGWEAPAAEYYSDIRPLSLSTAPQNNLGWTKYFCEPPATFKNLGSEWDWIRFFWKLHTEGGANQFTVKQIMAVWLKSINDNTSWTGTILPNFGKSWCVSGTTPRGEGGWSCRDYPWYY
ncbi:MAG: hypothetical protein JXR91_03015, partial [Deltaproteobacteria bacterium]|nr:hypothetical protein [Deltaproteobacteria bacterium]